MSLAVRKNGADKQFFNGILNIYNFLDQSNHIKYCHKNLYKFT